jgi:murein DD-endopeptidase MepM/ murein hydrolase activator NlpD
VRKLKRGAAGTLAGAATALAALAGPAHAAVPITVTPGETLSGIAATDGLPLDALAAYNGISPDSYLYVGQTIQIPSAAELGISTATSTTSTSTASTATAAPVPGLAPIYCPCGTVYLAAPAAAAWSAMREASLRDYGVDLYPAGPLSAYRTYAQQASLYDLFLSGQGAPADPPGTSSHELGTAVDLATPEMRSIVDAIGANYGWGKIHGPGEWWHVDYLG